LVWIIYRLDHDLTANRFDGYILYGKDNRKYFPDFIDDDTVIEIKGYVTEKTKHIIEQKKKAVLREGYDYKILFKVDLKDMFKWVKDNYDYKRLAELYDDYKPKYEYVCLTCGVKFSVDKKRKTERVFCSKKCIRPINTKVLNGLKGKTYEEVFGEEKAKEIKKKLCESIKKERILHPRKCLEETKEKIRQKLIVTHINNCKQCGVEFTTNGDRKRKKLCDNCGFKYTNKKYIKKELDIMM